MQCKFTPVKHMYFALKQQLYLTYPSCDMYDIVCAGGDFSLPLDLPFFFSLNYFKCINFPSIVNIVNYITEISDEIGKTENYTEVLRVFNINLQVQLSCIVIKYLQPDDTEPQES